MKKIVLYNNLSIAEHLCSWNNVRPEHLAAMRGLSRRGYITQAREYKDRRLELTESGMEAMRETTPY